MSKKSMVDVTLNANEKMLGIFNDSNNISLSNGKYCGIKFFGAFDTEKESIRLDHVFFKDGTIFNKEELKKYMFDNHYLYAEVYENILIQDNKVVECDAYSYDIYALPYEMSLQDKITYSSKEDNFPDEITLSDDHKQVFLSHGEFEGSENKYLVKMIVGKTKRNYLVDYKPSNLEKEIYLDHVKQMADHENETHARLEIYNNFIFDTELDEFGSRVAVGFDSSHAEKIYTADLTKTDGLTWKAKLSMNIYYI